MRDRALGEEVARSLNPGQAFVKIVHDELVTVLGGEASPLAPRGQPGVIMLVGLQGAGKTTTAAKLARHLTERGGAVLLVSTDVYRPAAREQLARLAADLGVGFFQTDEQRPGDDCDARRLAAAQRGGQRWLILDTAGRLHVDSDMMAEARELHRARRAVGDAVRRRLDGGPGRRELGARVPRGAAADGRDPDEDRRRRARRRGAVGARGHRPADQARRHRRKGRRARSLRARRGSRRGSSAWATWWGWSSRSSRASTARRWSASPARSKKGKRLSLEDYREQLRQLVNMGGIGQLLDKLPGVKPEQLAAASAKIDPKQFRRQIGIIDSMTPAERRQPGLIDGSRKRRIAAGAGLPVQEVSRLLKQHEQLTKTMKQLSKRGGMQRLLGAMRGGGGGGRRRFGVAASRARSGLTLGRRTQ